MKKILIPLYFVAAVLAITITSCKKEHLCECANDIGNEVVDSAAWLTSGGNYYLKSDLSIQPKTYLYDTLLQADECESLNYYDSVGVDYPEEGLRLHHITTCREKK